HCRLLQAGNGRAATVARIAESDRSRSGTFPHGGGKWAAHHSADRRWDGAGFLQYSGSAGGMRAGGRSCRKGTPGAQAADGDAQRTGQRRGGRKWSLQHCRSRNQHRAASDGLWRCRACPHFKTYGRGLGTVRPWKRHLHDLGECEVKHGVRVSVANLYTEDLGNPEVPQKFRQARKANAPVVREKKGRGWVIAAAVVLIAALIIAAVLLSRRSASVDNRATAALAIPEKSIAVMPFQNLSEDKANA